MSLEAVEMSYPLLPFPDKGKNIIFFLGFPMYEYESGKTTWGKSKVRNKEKPRRKIPGKDSKINKFPSESDEEVD